MTITDPWVLYLIFQADSVNTLLGILTTVSVLVTGIAVFMGLALKADGETLSRNYTKALGIFIATCVLLSTVKAFTPSTNALLTIGGITSVASIEGIDKLPDNLVKYLNTYLEEHVKQ